MKRLRCRKCGIGNRFRRCILFSTAMITVANARSIAAFTHKSTLPRSFRSVPLKSRLCYSSKGDSNDAADFDLDTLLVRMLKLRQQYMDAEYRRPPNPDLSPTEFVLELLYGLWNNAEPWPDSGFRLLLRASTDRWKRKLYESVGAPATASEEAVASTLGEAMGRPHNQFALLVGGDDNVSAHHGLPAIPYRPTFPHETLDYGDGTCWLECRFRTHTGDLLAATGWQLQQVNGAWLVDGIDWQDFRDEFRPGIGREEWVRMCG